MKRILSIVLFSLVASLFLSCTKTPDLENVDQGGDIGDSEEIYAETLVVSPAGDTLAFDVDVEEAWTMVPVESYDWVSMLGQASGEGGEEIRFAVGANYSDAERSAVFTLLESGEEQFKIIITQAQMVIPLYDGDFAFLKWLVDNKAYGDDLPVLYDWFKFDGGDFPGIKFDVDATGRYYITSIDMRASEDNADMLFNSFPPEIRLQRITAIYVNYTAVGMNMDEVNCPLMGSEFPSVWDCPMLERVHLECVGMVGVIPQSFADLPNLRAFFVRSCDLYGALPQKWASDKFESVVIGFNGTADCPNLGYMVPAQLDIILNSQKPQDGFHADRNEYKLGGYRENWVGYEEGWGQTRYEKFDPLAKNGNLSEWSSYRIISKGTADENAKGGIRNPLGTDDVKYIDSWESYYTNVFNIPGQMSKWNQREADAYTAEAAKRERLYVR